jgi:hypothetical protein
LPSKLWFLNFPYCIAGEIEELCPHLGRDDAINANRFYNYIIDFWFRLHGADAISVYGAEPMTNNRMER